MLDQLTATRSSVLSTVYVMSCAPAAAGGYSRTNFLNPSYRPTAVPACFRWPDRPPPIHIRPDHPPLRPRDRLPWKFWKIVNQASYTLKATDGTVSTTIPRIFPPDASTFQNPFPASMPTCAATRVKRRITPPRTIPSAISFPQHI